MADRDMQHASLSLPHESIHHRIRTGLLWFLLLLSMPALLWAETPAPSVHWGALAYPDRDRTLMLGGTFNRFTEFDGQGQRYNDINESAGFNLASLTWTERLPWFEGWNSNLTIGAGPTGPQPTRFLQNEFAHKFFVKDPVPVGNSRKATDVMAGGSLTRWGKLFGERETGFAGIGFSSGTLYHEANVQVGLRRVSLAEVAEAWGGSKPESLEAVSRFVRFSGMGRYGRLYGGEAYPVVAPQSYLGQFSVSLSDYRDERNDEPPRWELEISYTIDSGLYVDRKGGSIEEQFGSITLRFPYGEAEFWNDSIGRKDFGPTAGGRLMFNLLRIYEKLK